MRGLDRVLQATWARHGNLGAHISMPPVNSAIQVGDDSVRRIQAQNEDENEIQSAFLNLYCTYIFHILFYISVITCLGLLSSVYK